MWIHFNFPLPWNWFAHISLGTWGFSFEAEHGATI